MNRSEACVIQRPDTSRQPQANQWGSPQFPLRFDRIVRIYGPLHQLRTLVFHCGKSVMLSRLRSELPTHTPNSAANASRYRIEPH